MFHPQIREYLSVPEEEIIFCGMALGHADERVVPNTLVTERAPLLEFATIRETA